MGGAVADRNFEAKPGRFTASLERVSMVQRFREPIVNVGVALIVGLGLLQCWLIFNAMHGRASQNDFSVYYLTAKAVEANQNPYNADFLSEAAKIGLDTGDVPHATDPPTFVMMITPLAHLSLERAFWVWSIFYLSPATSIAGRKAVG